MFIILISPIILFCSHKPAEPVKLPICGHDTEKFRCYSLRKNDLIEFHKSFYRSTNKLTQDEFILKYVSTKPVVRHRVNNGTPSTMSSKYFIKNRKGYLVSVCLKTFIRVLEVSRFRVNRLTQQDFTHGFISENRGGFRKEQEYEIATKYVKEYLEKLEYSEAHYCRDKTTRKYLSADLNVTKLYALYKNFMEEEHPDVQPAKLSYFRFIFNNSFNFGFGTPRTDECSTCLCCVTRNSRSAHSATTFSMVMKLEIRNTLIV